MTDEDLAELMYEDWCNALGEPQFETTWDDLTSTQKKRWVFVASTVREPVLNEADSMFLEDIHDLEERLDEQRDVMWKILDLLKPMLNLKVLE